VIQIVVLDILNYFDKDQYSLEFEIMNHAIYKRKEKLEECLFKLVDKIVGDQYKDLHSVYKNLCKLSKGDVSRIVKDNQS